MKNILLLLVAIFFCSCSNHLHLEKEEAATVLKSELKYPHVLDYDLNTADPAAAKRVLDAGLEEAGLVRVDRTQKLKDAGNPLIHFTEQAKPYLIRIDPKYRKTQVVKIADVDVGEVTAIQLLEDSKRANIEYTLVYKNITPFAKLIESDFTVPKTKRASLSLFDTGWKLNKNPF